jgi:hypothetical protein
MRKKAICSDKTARREADTGGTHRKVSCGILASDAGNGPDKLLLFSRLRQERAGRMMSNHCGAREWKRN